MRAPRVVVAGGHSAGHIEPAMNFAGAARQRFGLRPGGPALLVTGGSQGARAINAAVHGATAALRAAGVQVLYIPGPRHAVQVPDGAPAGPPYVVLPYVGEMQYPYAAADFVVCRASAAGASDADVVLARHVLTAVAQRRRLAP